MGRDRIERQREVAKSGQREEYNVIQLLLSVPEIKNNFIIDKPSKITGKILNREELSIPYNNHSEEIDADICVIRKRDKKLVCVISVKKSFRERGAQTAYWAVKIKQHQKEYNYILATPDVDQELFNPQKPNKKRKWRIILPFECDGVFIYSFNGKVYKEKNFFVGKDYLVDFIRKLLNE
jgi:type II restriction enzyme